MWSTGDRVLAQRTAEDHWYPGVIRYIEGGRYFVIFDDGEDAFLGDPQLRAYHMEIGDRVFACPKNQREFMPAVILDKRENDLQLHFENSSQIEWTNTARVRCQPSQVNQAATKSRERNVGDRVWACWLDLLWYPGTILDLDDSQALIVFDDGKSGLVPMHRIRTLSIAEGDRVWGRYKAGQEHYPGVVESVNQEVVELAYDDGDREVSLVRLLRLERDEWLPEAPSLALAAGERVLACWFDGMWYPGTIAMIEGKRIRVVFDDADQANLTWERIRPLDFQVGDAVLCRWQGGAFYHPGLIAEKKGERILVHYEDGREEWTSIRMVRIEDPNAPREGTE